MQDSKKIYSNIILNAVNTLLKVLFPLISFKYAAVVLGVDINGTISFGASVISYFSLIAALGISTYSIREGAKLRENRNAINKFSSQIFTINIVSTILSYICLLIAIIVVDDFRNIYFLLIIQSSIIIFTTLSVEWIYSIFEDYKFITIRNLIMQFVSLILMFIFVKEKSDYYVYAFIQVLSNCGAFFINYFYAKKYCDLKICLTRDLKKHLTPILILFANNLAMIVYVNSDTTIVGFLISMSAVGVYTASVRIYSMFKTVVGAIVLSVLPRISISLGTDDYQRRDNIIKDSVEIILIVLIPLISSMIFVGKELIILTAGIEYIAAYGALVILSISLFFSTLATIITTFYLIPSGHEKYTLYATIMAAIVNILLNLVLIPFFGILAAAVTTLIAECIVSIVGMYAMRKTKIRVNNIKFYISVFIKCTLGCVPLILINYYVTEIISNLILRIFLFVGIGGVLYVIVLRILKIPLIVKLNNLIIDYLKQVKTQN